MYQYLITELAILRLDWNKRIENTEFNSIDDRKSDFNWYNHIFYEQENVL